MTYLAQNSNSEIYVIVNRHIISNQSLGPMGFKEAVLVLELTTVISKKPVSTCQEKFHMNMGKNCPGVSAHLVIEHLRSHGIEYLILISFIVTMLYLSPL